MKMETFVNLVADETGKDKEKIREGIKHNLSYPVGVIFEETIVDDFRILSNAIRKIDKMAEASPMSAEECANRTVEEALKQGLDKEHFEAMLIFRTELEQMYGDTLSSENVAMLNAQEFGDGGFMMEYGRIPEKQEGKYNDMVEDEPSYRLYIDTTPGEEGMRTYLYEIEKAGVK